MEAAMKRNRIGYIIIFLLSLIYIYFDGGFLPYTLFYIILILPLASFCYLLVVYYTFRYGENMNKREYQKGEILDYTMSIHNGTPLYIPYFTVFMHMEGRMLIKGMKNEHLTLKPFSRQDFHFNVPILYRGKYKIGISHIEVRDFLNLFRLKYLPGETKLIRVFPRILPMDEMDIPYMRISESDYLSQNINSGHTEIRDIREYMYGDSLKKIHWKLSSKYNKWLTKETNASSEKEFWLLLNLEQIEGEAEEVLNIEDRTIEVLVSMARVFLSAGIVLKLCFFRKEQVALEYTDLNGFEQLYELLAFMPFDQKVSFGEVMNYFIDSMPERQSVMVFSPVIDENHLDSLHKMNVNGHDVSLLYCEVSEGDAKKEVEKALQEEMPELGIRVINLFQNMKIFDEDKTAAG